MLSAGDIHIVRDTDNSGKVDATEFDQQMQDVRLNEGDILRVGTTDYTVQGEWEDFLNAIRQRLVSEFSENVEPSSAQFQQAKKNVEDAYRTLQQEQAALENIRNGGEGDEVMQQQIVQAAKQRLAQEVRILQQLNIDAGKSSRNDGISAEILRAAGLPEGEGGGAKATFAMTSGGQPGADTGAKAMGGMPMGFTPPANWGAQTAFPEFNTDAYMQSMMMEDNVLASFDSVLKSQNQGRNLMMLFFYFARMAESGDLGAMYQFMKFITFIISKDKSRQQTQMGEKLIELQDLSRQWTDKLLNMSTNATDPNASNEFMKCMTQVKSETDAIATSQKLISQMMEEFAQVVETLTNTTKSALEANGRVLRTVSTMR